MAETLLKFVIQVAGQICKLCQDAAEAKESLAAAGTQMNTIATVLKSIPPECAASREVSPVLQGLKEEMGKVLTLCQDAHAMRKPVYVFRAKHIQKDLENKFHAIQHYISTLQVGQNHQLYRAKARALEQFINMQDFHMAAANERKQLEELKKILELKDNEVKLAKLRENDYIQENADLQNIIRALTSERDDLHEQVQQADPNSIAFSNAKAEELYIDQIIALLNDVKIAAPSNNKTPPTLETAPSSESKQGIVESCYCPISAQIMKDPVLPHCPQCTQTCDRASLEQWFATGKASCPLCGHHHLLSNRIRPNAALRNTIDALKAAGILSGDHGDGDFSAQTGSPPKDGFKTHMYPDGAKYVGEWKNGKQNGSGKYVFASGDIYDGQWVDDKSHGHGVYTWTDGAKYVGEWKNGNRNGSGKCVYADGRIYDGQWVDDKLHGHGVYTWTDGAKYVGEWKNDNRNGSGKYVYADGSIYHDGHWVDDKLHGHGVLTWTDGAKYVGEWKNDKQNGSGKQLYADGSIYHVGDWEDGKPKKRVV